MADDFMAQVMATFQQKLKRQSDASLEEHLKIYKEKLAKLDASNKKVLEEAITEYGATREQLDNKLNANVNKLVSGVETKINTKISAASKDMDSRLAKIDDELFNDPNRLYKKIVNATDKLKKQRDDFRKERKLWDADDKRCAEWLGISYEDEDNKYDELEDEEEPANNAVVKREKLQVSNDDFITIKVDDRTFRTYRGTLRQVPDSFLAKLFGGHSDLIHRDPDGAYCLNCNPEVFGQVLHILRKRGKVTHDFKMTHSLYASLVEFGILDAYFPAFNISELGLVKKAKEAADYHVVFQSWRSTANNSYYVRWNKPGLSNLAVVDGDDDKDDEKDDEKKDAEDADKVRKEDIYWQLNADDDSELIIKKPGWYRFVFRACEYHSSANQYAYFYVNGSVKEYCYHSNQSTNRYQSYNFNGILEFKEGDKLRFYCSPVAYIEDKGSYFSIERVPEALVNEIGVYTSSSTHSNYRQWNSTIKASAQYSVGNSCKNIQIQSGGLFRVTARIQTYYGSAGSIYTSLYEYRNGGAHYLRNHQSNAYGGSCYECHMYDEVFSLKKDDYVTITDNGYLTASNAAYDSLCIEPIPFAHLVGHWRSSSVKDTYLRQWNYEQWCSGDLLYKLDDNKVKIKVLERGYYRVSAHLNNYQGNEEGYSALYINDQQYAISRMGCYNGTYYHTTSIQEIVSLKEGDQIHLYSSKPHNGRDYNSFWIQKLI